MHVCISKLREARSRYYKSHILQTNIFFILRDDLQDFHTSAQLQTNIFSKISSTFFQIFYELLTNFCDFPVKYLVDFRMHFDMILREFQGCAEILLKFVKRTLTITLDFDWFWRKFGQLVINEFNIQLLSRFNNIIKSIQVVIGQTFESLHKHNGPSGVLGKSWPTGYMAFWTTVLLGSFLLFYLFA